MMLPAVAGRAPVWPEMGANGAPVWPTGEDALHARFMTVRFERPADREIDVDVAAHGDGLISSWAMNAMPGQQIGVMGPVGNLELPDADTKVLAADLTGLPTIARALEDRAFGENTRIVAEAENLQALKVYLGAEEIEETALQSGQFASEV
mgnify:CR=1 FL=1